MVKKRSAYDPLQPTSAPRWQVVRSRHGAVIESHALPSGVNLKRLFIESMLKWSDAGWAIGDFSSSSGTFFCTRDAERRMVSIDATDPTEDSGSLYGPSRHGGCPTCDD